MSKFNRATGPIRSEQVPSAKTHEGAPGYAYDTKSELFRLAVSNFVGEDTFYESANVRDLRYQNLVIQATLQDSDWVRRFLIWLRSSANMRSASIVGLAEWAAAAPAGTDVRSTIDAVLQRADEPGEFLAYWTTRLGRKLPKRVKRGVADAARRLYTERGFLKYDSDKAAWRFADVINTVHPKPCARWQSQLFCYALDSRYDHVAWEKNNGTAYNLLHTIARNTALRREPPTSPYWLEQILVLDAGMTWENVLSAVGDAQPKRLVWAAMIPTMGYMATLRNLRNFDMASVTSDPAIVAAVIERLTDPDEVAHSRQLPYRFLSAYQAAGPRWRAPLDTALRLSLRNIPQFTGRTLVLVDTSASMTTNGLSARSRMTAASAAALFGVALAHKSADVDLYGYADGQFKHVVDPEQSVLAQVESFMTRTGEVGHGTWTATAVQATFDHHDRVIIISDQQTMSNHDIGGWAYARGGSGRRTGGDGRTVTESVPPDVPLFTFNLGGYQYGDIPSGVANRYILGGLTDHTFGMIPLLEAGTVPQLEAGANF